MNNASVLIEEEVQDNSHLMREKIVRLTETIEALQNIAGSSYWLVLKQNVFDVDLDKAKRRLAKEKDTTEIFRLQGEIGWGEKFSLETLLTKYRNELSAVRKQV